eukprot:scaffold107804_cov19-Prasinocladus_malaysianus.AAC.1
MKATVLAAVGGGISVLIYMPEQAGAFVAQAKEKRTSNIKLSEGDGAVDEDHNTCKILATTPMSGRWVLSRRIMKYSCFQTLSLSSWTEPAMWEVSEMSSFYSWRLVYSLAIGWINSYLSRTAKAAINNRLLLRVLPSRYNHYARRHEPFGFSGADLTYAIFTMV